MARVRLHGDLSRSGRESLVLRWYNHMPDSQVTSVLTEFAGLPAAGSQSAAKERPAGSAADLPGRLRELI